MLYREIIAVCSQIHTKHINTLCGQNVELLNVKLVVYKVSTGIESVREVACDNTCRRVATSGGPSTRYLRPHKMQRVPSAEGRVTLLCAVHTLEAIYEHLA